MLERIKQRLGLTTVTYDDTFFKEAWFRNWFELKYVLKKLIELNTDWRTILDFGCGPGAMIDIMNETGYNYTGCDPSKEARELYLKHYGDHPERFIESIDKIRASSFDLFLSFDVFEHMQDHEIKKVLGTVEEIPDFLFNINRNRSTPGHVNIKNDKRWIIFFEKNGLRFNKALTDLLRQTYVKLRPGQPDLWNRNLFVFNRKK